MLCFWGLQQLPCKMSPSTCALLTRSYAVDFALCSQIHLIFPAFALWCSLSSGYCVPVAGTPLKAGVTRWAPAAVRSCRAALSVLGAKPYSCCFLCFLVTAPPVLQVLMGGFSFLLLQKSEGHTSPTWWTAKWNVSGSSAYFLRWPVKLHFIVKHCALPNILALSLPREASQSIWWN